MLCDRRASRWMNGLCAAFALGALGSVGALVRDSKEVADGGGPPPVDRFHLLLDRARNAEGPDAEALYGEALRERPRSVLVRLERARLFEGRGDDARALAEYASFVGPSLRSGARPLGDSDTLARYGELCLRRGDEAEARRAFRMGTTPTALDRPAPVGAPVERLRTEAQAATTRALRRLAASPGATTLELAAGAHLAAGRRGAAVAHCRRAVELAPRSALGHLLLAVVLHGRGDPEASTQWAQARRLARGAEKADVERWAAALRARGPAGR